MIGRSISSGRVVRRATALSTSLNADSMSLPGSNSRRTRPTPSADCERTRFTPSMSRISGSMTPTILESTSSALAPGQLTETVIQSMWKSGKNCVLSRTSPTSPRTMKITISRLAATLCRANRASSPPRSPFGSGVDGPSLIAR